MLKSMTGFGKAEENLSHGLLRIEIRAINNKFFDISTKLPNGLSTIIEDKIQRAVHKHIKRGKVNLSISYYPAERSYNLPYIDKKDLRRYFSILKNIKREFGIKEDIKLSHLLTFLNQITFLERPSRIDIGWAEIEKVLKRALMACEEMRMREGRFLYKDISARCKRISRDLYIISKRAPLIVKEQKKKLDARINNILKGIKVDRSRVETEIALFAKQSDISEELTRARSHLEGIQMALRSEKETGRKIDFILQELYREVNTLGQKANDIHIVKRGIDIKAEIEKIREQIQNVE